MQSSKMCSTVGRTGFSPVSCGTLRRDAARCKILLGVEATEALALSLSRFLSRTNPLTPSLLTIDLSIHLCCSWPLLSLKSSTSLSGFYQVFVSIVHPSVYPCNPAALLVPLSHKKKKTSQPHSTLNRIFPSSHTSPLVSIQPSLSFHLS